MNNAAEKSASPPMKTFGRRPFSAPVVFAFAALVAAQLFIRRDELAQTPTAVDDRLALC